MKRLILIALTTILIFSTASIAFAWQDFLSDLKGELITVEMIGGRVVSGTVKRVIRTRYQVNGLGRNFDSWVLLLTENAYVCCQIDNIILVIWKN